MKKFRLLSILCATCLMLTAVGVTGIVFAADEETTEPKTLTMMAGDLVVKEKPAHLEDEPSVHFGKLNNHGSKVNPVGYVEHPAFSTVNKTNFADMEVYADGANNLIRARNIVYAIKVNDVLASDYQEFKLTMYWSDWCHGHHNMYLYGSGAKKFLGEDGKPAGYAFAVESKGPETRMDVVISDTSKLADENGKINYIYAFYEGNVNDTADTIVGTREGSQIWINEVIFTAKAAAPVDSLKLEAGYYVGEKPAYVKDENITFVPIRDHGVKNDVYGYVDHPAFATVNDKSVPNAELYNENNDIRATKLAFPLHFSGIRAADFAQFQMTFLWTDWSFGEHQFYLYGSGTEKFTDENGNPTGYVTQMKVKGPSTRFKITVDDLSLLANKEGNIDDLFMVYWGNTRDAESEKPVGTWKGTQLWVNELNFLLEKDVEKPVISDEYLTKDISEVLPVGEGWNVSLKSNGIKEGEGFGQYTLAGAVDTASYDRLDFSFKADYSTKFSIDLIMHAPDTGTDYQTGGLFFWFANDNIAIGAGNQVVSVRSNDYPEGLFTSGKADKFSVAAIPYYLEGVQTGYYLAVYVNDATEPLISTMVKNDKANISSKANYTKVILQDLGYDYNATYGPKAGTPVKTADEIMAVKLETTSGKTEYSKPRATLKTSHLSVNGESISDVIVEGKAVYNKDTGALQFDTEGTVTVYYKVTNVFGEFESNKLVLKYDDGNPETNPDGGNEEVPGNGCGCTGHIGGDMTLSLIVMIGAFVTLKIMRKDK